MSKELKYYKNVENLKVKDNNDEDRNIAGILKNYVYNQVSPIDLKCTRLQYNKFLELLDKTEKLMDEMCYYNRKEDLNNVRK